MANTTNWRFTTGKRAAENFTTPQTSHSSNGARRVAVIVLDEGVIQKHPLCVHLIIPISHHVFQAVRNERAPWLSCQMQFLTSSNDKVASSNPTSATANPNQKNSRTKQTCNTGIAQRQSVYNIVGHIFRLQWVRTTDGYRLISGRSQDRNLLPVYFNSSALQKQTVTAKRRQNTAHNTSPSGVHDSVQGFVTLR